MEQRGNFARSQQKMRISVCLLVILLVSVPFGDALSLKFKQISTQFPSPIGIDYHESTNSIVMTSNYPSGTPYNFRRIDFDGSQTQFSTAALLDDEIKITTVKSGNPIGFKAGDLFTGNGKDGEVLRITDDGQRVITKWCSLPGAGTGVGLLRGGLYVDDTGVFGYKLIVVTTAGRVYTVGPGDASCTNAQLLANAGVHLEGVLTTANNVARWGKMAGAILAGDEGNSRLYAFYPNGTSTYWTVNAAIEDLDYINKGQNFFGVNYGSGLLLGASWDQFQGHEGKILATQEFAALYLLSWSTTANAPVVELVDVSTSPIAPAQWEHVTFAPAGIQEILPADFSLCIRGESSGLAAPVTNIQPLMITGTAQANYRYNVAGSYPWSSSSTSPAPQANTLLMYFTQDPQNVFSLVLMVDSPTDSTGGAITIGLTSKNLGTTTNLVVQDDAESSVPSGDFADRHVWSNGQGTFTWKWGAYRTDGVVLSPLQFVNAADLFELTVSLSGVSGVSQFVLLSKDGANVKSVVLPMNAPVTLRRTSCTCGVAAKDAFEQCEGTACCTSECRFAPVTTVCRAATAGGCDLAETCTGTSGTCPTDRFQTSGTVCRQSTGVCDPQEVCLGTSADCPTDAWRTDVCRPAAHVCDQPESCSRASPNCPPDSLKPEGTACDDSKTCTPVSSCSTSGTCVGIDRYCEGVCGDGILAAQEQCDDGNTDNGDCCSSTCRFETSAVVCRASTGVCDPEERCTGNTGTCPNDERSTSVCRPVARACDVAEYCNPAAQNWWECPADVHLPDATICDDGTNCTASSNCQSGVCRGIDTKCQGVCGDGEKAEHEQCDDGNTIDGDCCSSTCQFEPPTAVCRESSGICDPAEFCTGNSWPCPAQQVYTAECRAVQRECDLPEFCNDQDPAYPGCPVDTHKPDNTTCDDQDSCTDQSTCQSGSCHGVDVFCTGICGDGIVARSEECDDKDNDCCSNCHFLPSTTLCRERGGRCNPPEFCRGNESRCPVDDSTSCPICPNDCSNHGVCQPLHPDTDSLEGVCVCDPLYDGEDCSIPICDIYSSCDTCSTHPDCGWCCGTNKCVAGTQNAPTDAASCPTGNTWLGQTCGCPVQCTLGGKCVCGQCDCPPGQGGEDCSWVRGCDNELYAPNDNARPLLDVCNICGGNGTSCLGCDGKPFGAKLDRCNKCGGDGRECWNLCPYKNCKDCTLAEGCTWCLSYNPEIDENGNEIKGSDKGPGVCVEIPLKDKVPQCREWSEDTCDSKGFFDKLTTTQKSLGGVAIALIIVGSAAGVIALAVGSKKGYDYYKLKSVVPVSVQNNPFYVEKKNEFDNPLYDVAMTPVDHDD